MTIYIPRTLTRNYLTMLKEIRALLGRNATLDDFINLMESPERQECERKREKAIEIVNGKTSCEEQVKEVEEFFDYFIALRYIQGLEVQSKQSNSIKKVQEFISKWNECNLNQSITLCAAKNKQYFTLMFT